MRGALIVFEGCDRAGKSSQARRVVQKLKNLGEKVELINFPDRSTDLGKFIDRYLRKEVEMEAREAHLVFAANRHACYGKMRQKLLEGSHFIVDRYAYSGIAYTLAKTDCDMGLPWAELHDVGILKPDSVLFFDANPLELQNRDGYGDERLEATDIQKKVYETMKCFQSKDQDMWKRIDASKSFDDVFEHVWFHIQNVISSVKDSPLQLIDLEPKRCV